MLSYVWFIQHLHVCNTLHLLLVNMRYKALDRFLHADFTSLGGAYHSCYSALCCMAQVISMDPLTRRSRFILCVAVGLGLGVTIVPNWATNNLWNVYPTTSSGLAGFRCFYPHFIAALGPSLGS